VSRGRLLFWGTLDTVGVMLNEDKLAIDVYQYSHATGQPITLGLVDRRLAELAGHRQCGCGLCESARRVRPFGVYRVASAWERSTSATGGDWVGH
jgi:hypothetical protein